jgi:hypothetical protein
VHVAEYLVEEKIICCREGLKNLNPVEIFNIKILIDFKYSTSTTTTTNEIMLTPMNFQIFNEL